MWEVWFAFSLFLYSDDLDCVAKDIKYAYQRTALDIILSPCIGSPLVAIYDWKENCEFFWIESIVDTILDTVLRRTYKLLGCQPYGFKRDTTISYEKPEESSDEVVEVSQEETEERLKSGLNWILEHKTILKWLVSELLNTWSWRIWILMRGSNC